MAKGINQQSVSNLKGIGDKTEKLFGKLGIATINDLLHYYPRGYDAFEAPVSLAEAKENEITTVQGMIQKTADIKRFGHLQVVTTYIRDKSSTLLLTWFNMPFLRATLKEGSVFVFRGKIQKKNGRYTMEQPEIFTVDAYQKIQGSLQPIYGQTKGLGNKLIVRAVTQALEGRELEREHLPVDLRKKYQLAEYNFALEHIHFPVDRQDLLFARKRLVFEEFFLFILMIRHLKEQKSEQYSSYVIADHEVTDQLLEQLPFQLTKAQLNVLAEIRADLSGGLVMNRLIQGDVGSGKTIIAVLALLQVITAGCQGALMAPTEVLARQHYESITELFSNHGIAKEAVLVTGSMTAKEKRAAYAKIKEHQADLIIGTHALIQEKVVYNNLALVITDEQHRFGVGQRETLSEKGQDPHVLVMSATPIPRTLAIILYGDLDISVIDELPANRKPIKNCVISKREREKAFKWIEREIAAGHQAYAICPMVEASEMIEAENVIDYSKLLKERFNQSVRVEYLHGKMKPKEKNKIMESFASGEIDILVSTTVVEVGVNVPNATVMVIENAERFGLAQLHQLRGRVGRGEDQSYCIMINGSDKEETSKRLEVLNQSNDGFFIAEEDLKLRGPGDIFGFRQSGDLEFKLADVFTDANILKQVSKEVDLILKADPFLEIPEHQELKHWMEQYLEIHYEKLSL